MSDYVIVVDLSANISMDFVREHDLIFIPMNYSIGSEERVSSEMESDEITADGRCVDCVEEELFIEQTMKGGLR